MIRQSIFLLMYCLIRTSPLQAIDPAPPSHSEVSSFAAALGASKSTVSVGQSIKNFAMVGLDDQHYELNRVMGRALVVFFTGVGCPVARESYAKLRELQKEFQPKGVEIWIVNSVYGETTEALSKEMAEFKPSALENLYEIPVMNDESQGVARMLGADRTATTVIIGLPSRKLLYRGAIDDQLTEGGKKASVNENYVKNALEQILDQQEVAVPETVTRGCLINFESVNPPGKAISYSQQVAPIINRKCAVCHSDGNIAPFSFSSHQVARAMSSMMEEVLLARRMPPWHADPKYGKFTNDISLALDEKRTLIEWISQGSQRDGAADPLAIERAIPEKWPYGTPDFIVKIPEPQKIPATGVIDYRKFAIKAPIDRDVWVKAIAVVPGEPKVVHHVNVYAAYEGVVRDSFPEGQFLWGWAPGSAPQIPVPDTGFLLPKDTVIHLEIHYSPYGKEAVDLTQVGFYLLQEPPKTALRMQLVSREDFEIAAQDPKNDTFSFHRFQEQVTLYSITPHMHTRGRSMKVLALLPNGQTETVLSVPAFNFNWQRSYAFAKPKVLPAGTVVIVSGSFDNSRLNPLNPAPEKKVRFGFQTTDEMFNAFLLVGAPRAGLEGKKLRGSSVPK